MEPERTHAMKRYCWNLRWNFFGLCVSFEYLNRREVSMKLSIKEHLQRSFNMWLWLRGMSGIATGVVNVEEGII